VTDRAALAALTEEIVACRRCPRLVEWRERVAREKVARFRDETYWGRPLPGFGDPEARILLVGLAPAAHGGNRTGRVFTGDASGDFLWAALHARGLADRRSSLASPARSHPRSRNASIIGSPRRGLRPRQRRSEMEEGCQRIIRLVYPALLPAGLSKHRIQVASH
jgi:uracil-DNA glycosylase